MKNSKKNTPQITIGEYKMFPQYPSAYDSRDSENYSEAKYDVFSFVICINNGRYSPDLSNKSLITETKISIHNSLKAHSVPNIEFVEQEIRRGKASILVKIKSEISRDVPNMAQHFSAMFKKENVNVEYHDYYDQSKQKTHKMLSVPKTAICKKSFQSIEEFEQAITKAITQALEKECSNTNSLSRLL